MADSTNNSGAGQAPNAGQAADSDEGTWNLRLYVAGQTPRSVAAIRNLRRICEEHMAGRYTIEIIDLAENPRLARDHQILAIPTLVKSLPVPLRKVIGDLSDTEKVLVGLDIHPIAAS